MIDVDYEKLTKIQKLAAFLVIIGPENAAEILKEFEDSEIESICREMTSFDLIDEDLQRKVLEEFSDLVSNSISSVRGGFEYAQKTLEMTRGDLKAQNLIAKLAPTKDSLEVIREIGQMEARQIYNLIKSEQTQTISFILSYLEVDRAAEIVSLLSPDLREEVIERMGTLEATSLSMVSKVVRNLSKHVNNKMKQTFHTSGGSRRVADVLNALDRDLSKSLLAKIEERNAGLGMMVRKKMFSFDDLIRLSATDLQRVMREVDMTDLAIAMKPASKTLREAIFGAISKRAAESLKEEMELMGPVRLRAVEAAQDSIIQLVRKLEEEEEITIDQGGDDIVK